MQEPVRAPWPEVASGPYDDEEDIMDNWFGRGLIALLILAAAPAAVIAGPTQSTALTPLLPARGAYYDIAKPGTGVSVDVGRNGFVFLTYYGYDSMGVPVWYSIQGLWTPSNEADRIATGIIGTLQGPLLYASGGQCITCDFKGGPTVTAESLAASVSWTTPRHLNLSIGDQSWQMDAVQYAVADADLIAGRWQLTISWDAAADAPPTGQGVASQTQVVTVEPGVSFGKLPIPVNARLDPKADPSIALPPPGSEYYAIDPLDECVGGPARLDDFGPAFSDIFSAVRKSTLFSDVPASYQYLAPMLWYAPDQHRGGLDVVTHVAGVDSIDLALGPNNVHFDLYVEPDRIVGHGMVQGQDFNGVPNGYWKPGSVMLNLVMQRLPDTATQRSIYPCMKY